MKRLYTLNQQEMEEVKNITYDMLRKIRDAKEGNMTESQALEGIKMDVAILHQAFAVQ